MALAHVIRLQIIKAAKNSPAIAIMIDESTDVSHTGQMVIYIRLRTTSGLCGGTRGVRARARSSISGGLVRVQAGGCGRELNNN